MVKPEPRLSCITAKQGKGKYPKQPTRTQGKKGNLDEARENAGDQVAIDFSFCSNLIG